MISRIFLGWFFLSILGAGMGAAQNTFSSGEKVVNNYDGLEATYSLVSVSEKTAVHVKLKNSASTVAVVELMITLPDGSVKLLPRIVISPGLSQIRNIGDILSFTTSTGRVEGGELPEKVVTQVRDNISKRDGKLISLTFGTGPEIANAKQGKPAPGLSKEQAKAVLQLIFTPEVWAQVPGEISDEDREKALVFLKDLVKTSCPMAVVEGIFNASYSFDYSLLGLARYIGESVEENCLQKKYESVRVRIASLNKGGFENRKQLGTW